MEEVMLTFIAVEEARKLVLEAVSAMPEERDSLRDALGRTLAGAVVSPDPVPASAPSAVDGSALRAASLASLPGVLRVRAVLLQPGH